MSGIEGGRALLKCTHMVVSFQSLRGKKDAKATVVSRKEISKVKRNFRVSAVSLVQKKVRKETKNPHSASHKSRGERLLFHYYCLLCLAAYFVFPRGIFIFIIFSPSRHGKKGKWRKVTFCPVECIQHVGYIFVFPDAQQKEKNRENAWIFPIISFVSSFMQFFPMQKKRKGWLAYGPPSVYAELTREKNCVTFTRQNVPLLSLSFRWTVAINPMWKDTDLRNSCVYEMQPKIIFLLVFPNIWNKKGFPKNKLEKRGFHITIFFLLGKGGWKRRFCRFPVLYNSEIRHKVLFPLPPPPIHQIRVLEEKEGKLAKRLFP